MLNFEHLRATKHHHLSSLAYTVFLVMVQIAAANAGYKKKIPSGEEVGVEVGVVLGSKVDSGAGSEVEAEGEDDVVSDSAG